MGEKGARARKSGAHRWRCPGRRVGARRRRAGSRASRRRARRRAPRRGCALKGSALESVLEPAARCWRAAHQVRERAHALRPVPGRCLRSARARACAGGEGGECVSPSTLSFDDTFLRRLDRGVGGARRIFHAPNVVYGRPTPQPAGEALEGTRSVRARLVSRASVTSLCSRSVRCVAL